MCTVECGVLGQQGRGPAPPILACSMFKFELLRQIRLNEAFSKQEKYYFGTK